MSIEYVRIQIRRDTYANWQSINPILGNGEFSLDITNKMLKIGDGTTRWMSLDGFPSDGRDMDTATKQDINTQTSAYTLVLSDAGKLIRVNSDSSVIITVPTSFSADHSIGTVIYVRQVGVGEVTIAGSTDVTINTAYTLVLKGQGAEVKLHYIGSNVWDITGDTQAI